MSNAPSASTSQVLLELRGITKQFTGTRALDGVDFTLRAGDIHALMGENGAGKSTLIKVLTGVYARDAGVIRLHGQPVSPGSPLAAQHLGISTVYQEVNLIPQLSVAENLFLGRQPGAIGLINWFSTKKRAHAALARLGLEHLDVSRPLNSYSIAIQQMVAIARAVDVSAKVLILDEPTSSLDEGEVKGLFGIMRRLASEGMGIVFVTHFMDQVYAVSNRITVLRNGRLVGEYEAAALPRLELIARMMGREVEHASKVSGGVTPTAAAPANAPTVLEAAQVGRSGTIHPMDFSVKAGETVGLAGLLGSGRTEFVRLLFGADRYDSGTLRIGGEEARIRSPKAAIARGMGFIPEDRKLAGIVPDLSVRENIILVLQTRRGWLRRIRPAEQREITARFIKALGIKTASAETPIRFLSGGNQQKAILARWLAANPSLLILDEPTRGIDIGAKFEIARYVDDLRQKGLAVIFISSELEEVARSCQRVVVLRDRHKVAELSGADVTEANIMQAIAHAGAQGTGTAH
ncbi:MAG TPA: sugar ABC transporter ATP-binding protein [Phycisphaerae bacterium]|nr:sugar ABC transporter ATP-binding protein [Phycisphaerae bacterium]